MEIYHGWFCDGSALYDGASSTYGPAPGYLAGGPNQYYSGTTTPPRGGPIIIIGSPLGGVVVPL